MSTSAPSEAVLERGGPSGVANGDTNRRGVDLFPRVCPGSVGEHVATYLCRLGRGAQRRHGLSVVLLFPGRV